MNPVLLAFTCGLVGGVAGCLATRYDLPGWVLHLWARLLGAWWFTPRYACPSCGRRVHLVRSRPDRAGIFGPADGGGRCLSCATSPRNAPQDAPGRTESREGVGLRVLGWDGTPSGAQGQPEAPAIQDRTDEGNDHA